MGRVAMRGLVRAAALGAGLVLVAGCARVEPTAIRIQGTVTAIGMGLPVIGADVIVEWPKALGGGAATVKTDTEGHYVVGRTVRTPNPDCTGIALTVRASDFASAYNRTSEPCGAKVQTIDFKLFPLTR